MLDIELKEVKVGDIVVMTRGNGVFKAELVKETECHCYFKYIRTATMVRPFRNYIFYIIKGMGNDNVLKL